MRPPGWHHTEISKEKMSRGLKGRSPWIKGKKHSEETRAKMSKALKGKSFKPLSAKWRSVVSSFELSSRHDIRRFLIKTRGQHCEGVDCKVSSMWNGKPITLQVEHINGVNDDNRDEMSNCCAPIATVNRPLGVEETLEFVASVPQLAEGLRSDRSYVSVRIRPLAPIVAVWRNGIRAGLRSQSPKGGCEFESHDGHQFASLWWNGRHAGLKIPSSKEGMGSSPMGDTKLKAERKCRPSHLI